MSRAPRGGWMAAIGAAAIAALHLAPCVDERAGPWLRRLAEPSVFSNVGGVAVELLARLSGAAPPATPPG